MTRLFSMGWARSAFPTRQPAETLPGAALAWNLKAWFGQLLADAQRGGEVVRMEFRRFLPALILLPAQIVRAGRRIIYRVLAYNAWVKDLSAAWERLRSLR